MKTHEQKNPSKKLIKLLKKGSDGGNGEFDQFLPNRLMKEAEEKDVSFFPYLREDNSVEWRSIS